MTCSEFQTAIADIVRDARAIDGAAEHAAQCNDCGEALAVQQDLAIALERLAREFRAERPAASVEKNLLAAYRAEHAMAGSGTVPLQQRWEFWLRAAAAIVVILGFGAWLLLSSGAPADGRSAAGTRYGKPGDGIAGESSGGFIPVLGYGPVSAADSGVVVRVLLPEDAFQYFPVPMARTPGGQAVPADVLLADDGSVRGIRLVSTGGGLK